MCQEYRKMKCCGRSIINHNHEEKDLEEFEAHKTANPNCSRYHQELEAPKKLNKFEQAKKNSNIS